jgi:hypothetical protein
MQAFQTMALILSVILIPVLALIFKASKSLGSLLERVESMEKRIDNGNFLNPNSPQIVELKTRLDMLKMNSKSQIAA